MIENMMLFPARHDMPEHVKEPVYPVPVNPADIPAMREICRDILCPKVTRGMTQLNLYVTGLSAALAEVIRFCYRNDVTLTLWHYNRETGEYMPQDM